MRCIDPWKLLDVSPGDPSTVLKLHYLEAIKKAHPDKGGTQEDASDINRAYDFLASHLIDGCVPPPSILPRRQPLPHPGPPPINFNPWGFGTTPSSTFYSGHSFTIFVVYSR